ncbi:MAG: sulfite exporter TauE/SafE family protein [Pseudomonadota bacterium]
MIELLPLIALLIGVGALAGFSAGLFGIGGGAVMVPALFFAFQSWGVSPDVVMHCAVATSASVIIVNGFRSTRSHLARDSVAMDLLWPEQWWSSYALWIGLGAFVGAVWLAPRLGSDTLTLIFAVVAFLVAMQFIFGRPTFTVRDTVPGGVAPPLVGGSVGALSAIMGIGGGSLSVPLLTLCGMPVHRAVGTAAGFGLAIAIPATLGFIVSGWGLHGRPPLSVGYVNLAGFALIVASAWFLVPLGTAAAHRLKAVPLRRIFGICLALVALNMAREAGLF